MGYRSGNLVDRIVVKLSQMHKCHIQVVVCLRLFSVVAGTTEGL